MDRPKLPQMGDKDAPASIGDLRAGRAISVVLALAGGAMLLWNLIGGGAVWLSVVFGVLTLVGVVGALSLHGQLHGWDAPDEQPW